MNDAMLQGLDVGSPQGQITATQWRQIYAQPHVWAMLRCIEGLGGVDATFAGNVDGSRAAGFTIGAYFVLHPWLDPIAQAQLWFAGCKALGFVPGELPPVIDTELDHDGARQLTPSQIRTALLQCARAMALLWGRQPMIYSYPYFLHAMIAGATAAELEELAELPLWYAAYQLTAPAPPAPWKEVVLWQQSGGNGYRVPGGEPCDADFFLGDQAALAAFAAPPPQAIAG